MFLNQKWKLVRKSLVKISKMKALITKIHYIIDFHTAVEANKDGNVTSLRAITSAPLIFITAV